MSAGVEIVGVKEALKELRRIDPELRKQFNRDAKQIVAPIVTTAKNKYPAELLSGMSRNWTQRGNKKFPYNAAAARRGITVKVDTRRKGGAAIAVIQKDPAASIADIAGRRHANRLATNLEGKGFGNASRFMWPAAEKNLSQVSREMEAAVRAVMNRISGGI